MADRAPLYGDAALEQVHEMSSAAGDTTPRALQAAGTLYDNAGAVPFTPRAGLVSTDTQSAVEEVTARYSGGRHQSYLPYTVQRDQDRVARIHRVGYWPAGASGGAEILHSHGTWGHLYPFGAFAAYNANGDPHRDHDRLTTPSGPDLVTNASVLSSSSDIAGFGKFIRTGGSWITDGYQVGKWVYPLGWTDAGTNGRYEVSAVSALELTVKDPADKIATEAAAANHEVRGTSSGASGHNGYRSGPLLVRGALDMEERLRFRAAGTLLSATHSDSFVEMVLEPNPSLDIVGTSQFTGANRMRMLTGALGATWTGTKRVLWTCDFFLGFSNLGTEYFYDWTLEIQDVLTVGALVHVTGGHNFKETAETYLVPRFRVDRIANLDIYDATHQDPAERLLVFNKLDVEPVH